MDVDFSHLEQGLSKYDASNETWIASVAEACSSLKSALNVGNDYHFKVELEDPFEFLTGQLNALIALFQGFARDNLLLPLLNSIREFIELLQQIFKYLRDTLNDVIRIMIDEIKAFCEFDDIQFFIDLKNDSTSFKNNVSNKIKAIGDLITDFIDSITVTVMKTVRVFSTFKINIEEYKIANNIEVDVLNHFK
jgi:hypothetical protein